MSEIQFKICFSNPQKWSKNLQFRMLTHSTTTCAKCESQSARYLAISRKCVDIFLRDKMNFRGKIWRLSISVSTFEINLNRPFPQIKWKPVHQ